MERALATSLLGDTRTQASIPKHLAQRALESNKILQQLLTQHAEQLEAELLETDRLLLAAGYDEGLEEADTDIQVPGAKKAAGPFSSFESLNPDSPFFPEASRRSRYLSYTNIHPMKVKELETLASAVQQENKRLQAMRDQRYGPGSVQIDLVNNVEGLDWNTIAEKVSDVSKVKRTPDECRVRWIADKHPLINHGEWKAEESSRLEKLVSAQMEEAGKVDWVEVAKKLETNRTPIDCMRHGMQRQRHIWTPEADEKLLAAMEIYGVHNWSIVTTCVSEHASVNQCQNRYWRSVEPSIIHKPWSEKEDMRLRRAQSIYGKSWRDIASCIPGRTNEQCRERSDSLNAEPKPVVYTVPLRLVWTEEEDVALLTLVKTLGHRWRVISEKVGNGKGHHHCRARYLKLKRLEEEKKSGELSIVMYRQSGYKKASSKKFAITQSIADDADIVSTAAISKRNSMRIARGKGKGEKIVAEDEEDESESVSEFEDTNMDAKEDPITVDKEGPPNPKESATRVRRRAKHAPSGSANDGSSSTAIADDTTVASVVAKSKPKPRPIMKGKGKGKEKAAEAGSEPVDGVEEMNVDGEGNHATEASSVPKKLTTRTKGRKLAVSVQPGIEEMDVENPETEESSSVSKKPGTRTRGRKRAASVEPIIEEMDVDAEETAAGEDSSVAKKSATRARGRKRAASVEPDIEEMEVDAEENPVPEEESSSVSKKPATRGRGRKRGAFVEPGVEGVSIDAEEYPATGDSPVSKKPTTRAGGRKRAASVEPAIEETKADAEENPVQESSVRKKPVTRGRGRKKAAFVESSVKETGTSAEENAVMEEPSVATKPTTRGRGRKRLASVDPAIEELAVVKDVPTKPMTKGRGKKRPASVEPANDESISTAAARPRGHSIGKGKAKQVHARDDSPLAASNMDTDEAPEETTVSASPGKTNNRKRAAPQTVERVTRAKKAKMSENTGASREKESDGEGDEGAGGESASTVRRLRSHKVAVDEETVSAAVAPQPPTPSRRSARASGKRA